MIVIDFDLVGKTGEGGIPKLHRAPDIGCAEASNPLDDASHRACSNPTKAAHRRGRDSNPHGDEVLKVYEVDK